MFWQHEYLREGATMTRGQTYRIDLPETGLVSGLMLKVSANCTSGATLADPKWRLLDFLPTIEVIGNGATVIKSLSAKHLHFLSWLHQGIVPPHFWRNYATNTQFDYIPILFGRGLFDPTYGLDLSRWDNVELRVTNDASATYYGTDLSVSIMQYFLRGAGGGFQGYLRSELWRQWATVQNETRYFILPTEYPITGLYLRALPAVTAGMSDTGFSNLMADIDLSVGGGATKLYKGGLDDLVVSNYLERGAEVITSGLADLTADKGVDVGVGRMFGWSTTSGSKDGAVSAVIPTMIADATDNTISFEAGEADSPVEFMTRGMAYQNMAYLLHDQDLSPDWTLDPKRDGETRLNITTANSATAAGGTDEIVLERLVTA